MNTMISDFSVYTLDQRELLPAGSVISTNSLEPFSPSPVRTFPMLTYGSIRRDICDFMSHPPYDRIFHDRKFVTEILGVMDGVELILPFLESLDYFRAHDFYTYRHTLMVFALSTCIARDLVPDYQDWRVRQAATGPMHDFGKICVPLDILRKTTPLTKEEHRKLSHHTTAGYVLLSHYLGSGKHVNAIVARDHHERKNGSGYPRGIRLEDFLVEIVAVSDIYDALISPRPYRPVSYDIRTALEVITEMAEKGEVSWRVVQALVALNRSEKKHFSETHVSLEKRGEPPRGNVHGLIADSDKD